MKKHLALLLGLPLCLSAREKNLDFGDLSGYALNGLNVKYEGKQCLVTASPKAEEWGNFTCRIRDQKKVFKLSPQEWDRAKIRFYINDLSGKLGTWSLKIWLRTHIGGHEIWKVGGLDMTPYVAGKRVDADKTTFQKVEIPFSAFKDTKALQYTVDSAAFQFFGTGKYANVILKDFSIIVPEK